MNLKLLIFCTLTTFLWIKTSIAADLSPGESLATQISSTFMCMGAPSQNSIEAGRAFEESMRIYSRAGLDQPLTETAWPYILTTIMSESGLEEFSELGAAEKFRGRGYIGLTSKHIYRGFAKEVERLEKLGTVNFEAHPELKAAKEKHSSLGRFILNEPEAALGNASKDKLLNALSVLWYWKMAKQELSRFRRALTGEANPRSFEIVARVIQWGNDLDPRPISRIHVRRANFRKALARCKAASVRLKLPAKIW